MRRAGLRGDGTKGRIRMELPDFEPLKNRLWEDGVAQIGFSDLRGLLPERYAHLPYGITLVFRLCSGVLDEVEAFRGPTFAYFQHYRAVNAALDNAALRTAVFLERCGFCAMVMIPLVPPYSSHTTAI